MARSTSGQGKPEPPCRWRSTFCRANYFSGFGALPTDTVRRMKVEGMASKPETWLP
jgi:hypothetical protein